MTDTLKSLRDRLSWISSTDKQAIWLHNYLSKQGWFDRYSYADIFDKQGTEFLTSIKYEWSRKINTATERERISKARSAWNSYAKESKNQTYSLSSEAKNKVNQLANKNNITRSRVIERLIMQAENMDQLELRIRKLLKSINVTNGDGSTIKYNINSVSDILKVNELKSKLDNTAGLLRESELELNELIAPTNKKEDKSVGERPLSVDTISKPDDNQSSKLTSTEKVNNDTPIKNELACPKPNESQYRTVDMTKTLSVPFATDTRLFNYNK